MQLKNIVKLDEDSSISKYISHNPGGDAVLKHLHTKLHLPHDAEFTSIPKIQWNDIKGGNSWILLTGTRGTGAVKYSNRGNEAIAAGRDNDVKQFLNDRGGNVLAFLEPIIGTARRIYTSAARTSDVKKRERAALRPAPKKKYTNGRDYVLDKMHIAFEHVLKAAEADVKGVVSTMLKNGNYKGASTKIEILKRIDDELDRLHFKHINTDDYHHAHGPKGTWFKTKIDKAAELASHHLYTEHTADQNSHQRFAHVDKLYTAILSGDAKAFGTLIRYLKIQLVH